MSELLQSTTSNGHEIKNPTERLTAGQYRELLASEFGIDGATSAERVAQLKSLSHEGVAIMLEKINHLAQGSAESLINHEKGTPVGGKATISPEHRYDVFTSLIEKIKNSSEEINPARVGDSLSLGVVLLHPFHDGNGRTARLLGLTFRDEFDSEDYEQDFEALVEPRDIARERGGYMINGYIPRLPEGADRSDPTAVSDYLSGLLTDEFPGAYEGPFGQAPLRTIEHFESSVA